MVSYYFIYIYKSFVSYRQLSESSFCRACLRNDYLLSIITFTVSKISPLSRAQYIMQESSAFSDWNDINAAEKFHILLPGAVYFIFTLFHLLSLSFSLSLSLSLSVSMLSFECNENGSN